MNDYTEQNYDTLETNQVKLENAGASYCLTRLRGRNMQGISGSVLWSRSLCLVQPCHRVEYISLPRGGGLAFVVTFKLDWLLHGLCSGGAYGHLMARATMPGERRNIGCDLTLVKYVYDCIARMKLTSD